MICLQLDEVINQLITRGRHIVGMYEGCWYEHLHILTTRKGFLYWLNLINSHFGKSSVVKSQLFMRFYGYIYIHIICYIDG